MAKGKAKGAAKRAATTGLEMVGIHKDHLSLGKAIVAAGLGSSAVLECWDGVKPIDYILPPAAVAEQVNKMDVARRLEYFLRGCAVNLTGQGAPSGAHATNAGTSGKVAIVGGITHAAGKTKLAKKLTRGLPVRL